MKMSLIPTPQDMRGHTWCILLLCMGQVGGTPGTGIGMTMTTTILIHITHTIPIRPPTIMAVDTIQKLADLAVL